MGGRLLPRVLRSMSARLIVRLFVIVALVVAAYAVWNYESMRADWESLATDNAVRTAAMVKAATHYGMLANRKDAVHHTITKLSEGPGVVGIRVYDKQGVVAFSNDGTEVGHRVDARAEACVMCHEGDRPRPAMAGDAWPRIFEKDGQRVLGLIAPIENAPGCARSGCHGAPPEETILGVLDVQMSLADEDQALDQAGARILWTTLVMLLAIAVGTAIFVLRVVQRPIATLTLGTRYLAAGELDHRIRLDSSDEMGLLASAFNKMAEDLDHAYEQLTGWSRGLEAKVVEKTQALQRVQEQVAHMDKMASLGKLSATVAHELNNPLAGMLTYARLIARELEEIELPEEQRAELARWVELIRSESARCGNIVRNLLVFARHTGAAPEPVHVTEILDRCLMLVRHHLEMANVDLQRELDTDDDVIIADAGQVEQALVALLVNAVESMAPLGSGTLTVRMHLADEEVEVDIQDTGPGIPPEIRSRIFEPFFSTKEQGHGVGLGLSVVYGIARRHGGEVTVDSQVGVGTTFTLRLPRRPRLATEPAPDQPHASS